MTPWRIERVRQLDSVVLSNIYCFHMDFLLRLEQSGIGTWVNQSDTGYPGILLVHTIGMTLLAGTSVVIGLRILVLLPRYASPSCEDFSPYYGLG